jgi:hypothetical protein
MGSPQTSINTAGQPIAFQGLVTKKLDSLSVSNYEASANLQPGLGVKPGTGQRTALLPTASSSVFMGIVAAAAAYAPGSFGELDQASTPAGYIPDTLFECVTKGRAWVQVDADCAITPNVTRAYWRFETDGASNTKVGTFRHTDDGHVVDTTKQCIFRSGVFTAADGTKIAELDFNTDIKP